MGAIKFNQLIKNWIGSDQLAWRRLVSQKKWIVGSLFFLILLCVVAYFFHHMLSVQQVHEPVIFDIPKGSSSRVICQELRQSDLIRSSVLFNLYVQWRGVGTQLKAGRYQLDRSMSLGEIIDQLQKGQVVLRQFVIPEGLTIKQIAHLWETSGFGSTDDFLQEAGRKHWQQIYDLPEDSLEGYLFPETYWLANGSSAETVIKTMLEYFHQQWLPEMTQKSKKLGMSLKEIITLASIIEKEAQVDTEREVISSVYHNRLRKGWKLDADPTVLYGLGNPPRLLTRADLSTNTPYNTYLRKGLPLGPICNPGHASIMAALQPAQTNFFYFVAAGNGRHNFSQTLDQHQQMVRRYRRTIRKPKLGTGP